MTMNKMDKQESRKYLVSAIANIKNEIKDETVDKDRKSTLEISLKDMEDSLKILDSELDL